MSEEQYLLLCLEEELLEAAHAVSKAIRFGLDDAFHLNPDLCPRSLIRMEMIDVQAMWRLIFDIGIMTAATDVTDEVEAKKRKVRAMMEYSRSRGRLAPATSKEAK